MKTEDVKNKKLDQELNDDDLNQVAGGAAPSYLQNTEPAQHGVA